MNHSLDHTQPVREGLAKHAVTFSPEEVDALLVLSFGAPEGPDEVRPFLENVTRGRGIPPERLDEVGAHYYHFGGKSPLNDLNREIIANVEEVLRQEGIDIPVYFGNRNWHPLAGDTAQQMSRDGVRKALVFATSAWGGYSGCKQYDEDILAMREVLAESGLEAIDFLKIRQFFDHPEFIELNAEACRKAMVELDNPRLVFTAHSIPVFADRASGTPADGSLYSRQVLEASRLVAEELGVTDYDVVWQSASDNGSIPWLEPDIVDHTEELAARGVREMVVCPIGFISDHMEVIWDLDEELKNRATELGITMARAETVGHLPAFARLVVDLAKETMDVTLAQHAGTVISKGCTLNGAFCEPGCCPTRKR